MIYARRRGGKLVIDVFGGIDTRYEDSKYDSQEAGYILGYLDDPKVAEIEVRIDSTGGDLFSAEAVANAIKAFNVPKSAIVLGACMSAAVPILLSCEKRIGGEHTFYMFHSVSTFARGNEAEIERVLNDVKEYNASLFSQLTEKLSAPQAEIQNNWDNETIFSVDNALLMGLITEKLDVVSADNPSASFGNFSVAAYSPFAKVLNSKNDLEKALADTKAELEKITASSNAETKPHADGAIEKLEKFVLNLSKDLESQTKLIAEQKEQILNLRLTVRNSANTQIPPLNESKNAQVNNELRSILNLKLKGRV